MPTVDFGGHIRFTYNGTPLVIRGKVEREATNMESSEITNENGSVSQVGKPKAQELMAEFEDADVNGNPVNWEGVVFGGRYNIAVIEEDTGVTHNYSNAFFKGKPKIDRLNGLVTGLSIVAPRGGYQQISR
jgi:hypothetical protein